MTWVFSECCYECDRSNWHIEFGINPYPGTTVMDTARYHREWITFTIDHDVKEDGSVTFTVYCTHPEVHPMGYDGHDSRTYGFKSLQEAKHWCMTKLPERFK